MSFVLLISCDLLLLLLLLLHVEFCCVCSASSSTSWTRGFARDLARTAIGFGLRSGSNCDQTRTAAVAVRSARARPRGPRSGAANIQVQFSFTARAPAYSSVNSVHSVGSLGAPGAAKRLVRELQKFARYQRMSDFIPTISGDTWWQRIS